MCQLPSSPGTTLPTEIGRFTRKSHTGWEAIFYISGRYFGPFLGRRGRSLVKRYGVIFTCLAIWAVHIEIAHSLDTDSFLLALRRFIARRGQVREIYSDNGSNFASGEVWPATESCVMQCWSRIWKRYTTLFCRKTSSGPSALHMVLTLYLGKVHQNRSENPTSFAPRANHRWRKFGHLNVRSRKYHEQPTHYHRVQWSKRQWALDA